MDNPYAPPNAPSGASLDPLHAPGRALSWAYGACIALGLVLRIGAMVTGSRFAQPLGALEACVGLAALIVAMAWIYAAWSGIPQVHRGTLSPRRAVLSFFIPLYNVYWSVAMNVTLCDTLNALLEQRRSDHRAPRVLAIVASAVWLASYLIATPMAISGASALATTIFTLAAPTATGALWFAFMIACDRAREEVAQLGAADAAPRLAPIQQTRGPGVLAALGFWGLLALGLACWQVLSPTERHVDSRGEAH